MRNYFIDWKKAAMDSLQDAGKVHFYAIESKGEIQYLGLSFGLDLAEEVQESLDVFGLEEADVQIWGGRIIRNIHNEVDLQLAEEVLCLMVYNTKPHYNVICKRSYYGRDGLVVHNRGNNNLPGIVRTVRRYHPINLLTGS